MALKDSSFFKLPKDVQAEFVAEYFRITPLAETAVALKALQETEYEHRLANKGFAPLPVFESLLGPDTVSVQIVHEVRDENGKRLGYALRLRDANEAGYGGLYHNTCCSMRWLDDLETALARDDSDAFQGTHPSPIEKLGVTKHHEIPRKNMDFTFMHRRVIAMEDIAQMNGTWKFFSDEEIRAHPANVVESNWYQLEWAMDENRPEFGVLHDSFPPELRPAK